MDGIIDLFNLILKISFIGGLVIFVSSLLKFKKSKAFKTEITNLTAKLSKLRLSLKGKVKKKSHVFRSQFKKTAIAEGDMIDMALKQLIDNPFETSEQFQGYFDLSRRIVNFIQVENNIEPEASNIENNFMCSDFKTEMDIVRIIREMWNVSCKINSRIDENNVNNPNSGIKKVDSLNFDSMADINRVFRDEGQSENFEHDDAEHKAS